MAQTIIIDGYNLIHKIPHLKSLLRVSLEQTREQLFNLLSSYVVRKKIEIVLVFDGSIHRSSLSPWSNPKVRVIFSKAPQKADQLIKSIVEQTKNKRLLTVVSSDREVRRFGRVCGCEIQSSDEFYRALKRRAKPKEEDKKDQTLSEEEVKEWLKIFESRTIIKKGRQQ